MEESLRGEVLQDGWDHALSPHRSWLLGSGQIWVRPRVKGHDPNLASDEWHTAGGTGHVMIVVAVEAFGGLTQCIP